MKTLKIFTRITCVWGSAFSTLAFGCALVAVAGAPRAARAQAVAQPAVASSSASRLPTQPCRVLGFKTEVQCGVLKRPLDPAQPSGPQIDIHFTVIPAVARNKKTDALFFFAGGPGQSAIKSAPQVIPWFSRLNNWRDIVFVDQRGTGKSAPLNCTFDERTLPLAEMLDVRSTAPRMQKCLTELASTPQGKALDQFTTTIAMQDIDAVRATLGYEQINLVGVSYGTRAVLEYARQYPTRVRRAVLDGVAPPNMVLPMTFSADGEAALNLLLSDCAKNTHCTSAYPSLASDWQKLLAQPSISGRVIHPITGREESVTLDRDLIVGLLRGPLYLPVIAAAVPHAITEAAAGRLTPLVGIGAALGGASRDMAWGMHFAVICSEDFPRMATMNEKPGAVFGEIFAATYRDLCPRLPRAKVPDAFYSVPTAQFSVLALSGGADPATPARHGESTVKALGAKAKHIVVPQAGHGIIGIGCMRDVVFRFFDAADDAQALAVDASCVTNVPRPTAWVLPGVRK